MIELNAASRLVADAKAEIAKKVQEGKFKIIDGEGQRFMAVEFPNGRFGIVDCQAPGTNNTTKAAGLDRTAAIQGAIKANSAGYFGAFMTMQR